MDTFGSFPSSLDGALAMPHAATTNGVTANHDGKISDQDISPGTPLRGLSTPVMEETCLAKSSSSPAALNRDLQFSHRQQPDTFL